MKCDQEKEVAAGRLAGCLKTVQSIRKLAFRKPFLTKTGFCDRIRLASVWKVGQVSIPAYSVAAMESRPTEFPDKN